MNSQIHLSSAPNIPNQDYKFKRVKNYLYALENVLGKGNFSTVYQAVDQITNQDVAIKVVENCSLTFKKLEDLLEQEIQILQRLNHQNVLKCIEVLKSRNNCYIITEICPEGSLDKKLKEKGCYLQCDLGKVVMDIFSGLKYLNKERLIHRDLKPANIFLKDGVAKIADFGFAIESRDNFFDFNIGSPLYMSPEGYINNQYGPKTDVWSFGVILFELTHGCACLSYCKSDNELKCQMVKPIQEEQFTKEISLELKHLITRCLDINEKTRITIEEIEKSQFMRKVIKEEEIRNPKKKYDFKRHKNVTVLNSLQSNCSIALPTKERTGIKKNSKYLRIGQNNRHQKLQCKVLVHRRGDKENQSLYEITDINQNSENKSLMLSKNRSITLTTQNVLINKLTFNQAIGLIHFCRLCYKFINLKAFDLRKDTANHLCLLIKSIFEEILNKNHNKMIVFDVQESISAKEKRLTQVINDYLIKYEHFFKNTISKDINCYALEKQLRDSLKDYEVKLSHNSSSERLMLVYFNLMVLTYLSKFIDVNVKQNYKEFGFNFDIEACIYQENYPQSKGEYEEIKRKKFKDVIHQKIKTVQQI